MKRKPVSNQLLLLSEDEPSGRAWRRLGVTRNPFFAHDVDTPEVLYQEHLDPNDLRLMKAWLFSVTRKDESSKPLAIKGTIGAGKTHWLRAFEHDARQTLGRSGLVTSHVLTGHGMKNLSLGALLWGGLASSELPKRTFRAIRDFADRLDLPPTSPLHSILPRMAKDYELVDLAVQWLSRAPLSKAEHRALGVAGVMDSEGPWVRALAHVAKLAKQVGSFRRWVVLIDQLEDLWRPHVTTPLRRARFLTELRTLVDEALAGAPIAIALAWNTSVESGLEDISDQLTRDYAALFSRLEGQRAIDIPPLAPEHLDAFAYQYVNAAAVASHSPRLEELLRRDLGQLKRGVAPQGMTAREWLTRLADWANEIVEGGASLRRE
ncbi:MAG: DUF2791 family P-loop domain-containing protein [Polyangiaceae bacterium]|nr:DUF2791 family P-loop domain-containing protein [Polyangiaceae bacterium]